MSFKSSKNISRKRFLFWSSAVLSTIGLIKIWNPFGKKKQETAKFLTQDGKLVEVDKQHLNSPAQKMYTSDLKDWVKK